MSAVADNLQTEMPAPILFTDSAAAKVADLIAEGRLEALLCDWRPPPLGLYMITPPSPLRPLRVRLLMNWLAEQLKNPPWARIVSASQAAP